ncbi:MAG: ester cyclase [Herpetosiphon sp.]
MSVDEHKAIVRRFFAEVFNRQNQETAHEIIAPTFIAHHPAFPQGIHGPQGILEMMTAFHVAFPDLQYQPEDVIAEGDKVAARWIAQGTHRGVFLGVPPTGKHVTVVGIDVFRLADGKLAEAWVSSDFLGLMQQIGAVPAGGSSS